MEPQLQNLQLCLVRAPQIQHTSRWGHARSPMMGHGFPWQRYPWQRWIGNCRTSEQLSNVYEVAKGLSTRNAYHLMRTLFVVKRSDPTHYIHCSPSLNTSKVHGKKSHSHGKKHCECTRPRTAKIGHTTGKFRHSWLVETTTQLHHWRTHYTPTLSPSVPLHFRTPGRFGNFGLGPLGPLGPRTSVIPPKRSTAQPPTKWHSDPIEYPSDIHKQI